jgi:hypothetical protein
MSQYGLVNQGTQGAGDFLTNLSNQYQGQQGALTAEAMQNALLARRAAVGQAAGIAQGAVGSAQYQTLPTVGPGFGELAKLIAYNQTLKAGNQPAPAATTGGGPQLTNAVANANNLPSAGVQAPPPPPGATPGVLQTPDMSNLPGFGMRSPYNLPNLQAAQGATPGASAQSVALNR